MIILDKSLDGEIERHRTALVRYQLSQPVQLLNRWGFLDIETSFFDYGCGRGDDVQTLREAGLNAHGWDPYYAPSNPKVQSDIVNIGFVLNVIENTSEREEALTCAWRLTSRVLSVAVINPYSSPMESATRFNDGVITSRSTFQKYFSQAELKAFIQSTLNVEPIAMAPGIFWVFKDEVALQEFLISKFSRNRKVSVDYQRKPLRIVERKINSRFEHAQASLEHLSDNIMELGRLLHESEVSPELRGALSSQNISVSVAQNFCLKNICDPQRMSEIAKGRRDDLLLYFASEIFSRHKPYRQLPVRLQQDIRFFWGSYLNAQEEARELIFSVGDKQKILEAANLAMASGQAYLLAGSKLQFHQSSIKGLPLILRCYVACGSVLFGDIEDADLVKIHIESRKLSLLYYEDFESLLPVLAKRVKIDLRAQDVRFYNYDRNSKQYLFLKSRFIPNDFDSFESQIEFDRILLGMSDRFDFSGLGPSADEFDSFLRQAGGLASLRVE